jgi:hypothetical protein
MKTGELQISIDELKDSGVIDQWALEEIMRLWRKSMYTDAGFYIQDSNIVPTGTGHVVFCRSNLRAFIAKSDRIARDLGDLFDRDYVQQYIAAHAPSTYEVMSGINSLPEPDLTKIDVDFILVDKDRQQYFFVQTKYFVKNLAYRGDELRLFCDDKNFKKGLYRQLVTLRRNLNAPRIRRLLAEKGIANADHTNSHYVLLHNLAELDCRMVDGIVLYDWNTFRNLIQQGQVLHVHVKTGVVEPRRLTHNVPLEDIDFAIQTLIEGHPEMRKTVPPAWKHFNNRLLSRISGRNLAVGPSHEPI